MRRFHHLTIVLAFLVQAPSYAQGGLRDTSIMMVPLNFSYAYQVPNGDMAQTFGWNNNVGFGAAVKFKNNYSIGLESAFLFGNQVIDRSMLNGITTSNGVIVNQDGHPAEILLFERGWTLMAVAGKVIPVAGPNPNSGILLKFGAGYIRHKVLIQSQNDVVPAIEDEYLKGYDRLTAGPMSMLYAGYQHLSNNRLINFTIGFELNLGFTKSLRPYDFALGKADNDRHFDGLNGLRFGWVLPIYHARDDRQFYR